MKNYSSITENKDITTKEYVGSNFMPFSGGTFTGSVTFSSGQAHLRTDLIKSADDSKWIAEFTSAGLEIGGSGTPLRFYSSTRPIVVNQNKELAYTSDIPDISGKLDKTKYEVNKVIDFGSTGVLYVGRFNVYDTNITCDITSTTSTTYSGKLVIATQNYVITKMTVYGDASNTVAPNFFIRPSSSKSDPYVEIYFKPAAYSKNVVHIYGSSIAAEPTNVCTSISAVPNTATHKPINALTETFQKKLASIDGLGGGTLTSPLTLTGGDATTASKIILTANGQITDQSTSTLFGRSGGVLIVGHQSIPLRLRGSATNPVYSKDNKTFKELAFKSDIPTLAKVATTGSYTDLSNTPTILSEADVKGIKVNNAVYADSAGYVKNSIVYQGVGLNADANYSNFVTYNGSTARSIKFYKYDFQMQDALGSGDAELTLRNTGVTAGTYNSVTVDTKGRVTAGTNTPAVDTSNLAKLDTENTFTKGQVITGQTSDGYSVKASGYVKGSWLQSEVMNNKGSNTGKVCVFDGNGWIYYRTPSEILSEASGVPKSAFSLSGTTLTITI